MQKFNTHISNYLLKNFASSMVVNSKIRHKEKLNFHTIKTTIKSNTAFIVQSRKTFSNRKPKKEIHMNEQI